MEEKMQKKQELLSKQIRLIKSRLYKKGDKPTELQAICDHEISIGFIQVGDNEPYAKCVICGQKFTLSDILKKESYIVDTANFIPDVGYLTYRDRNVITRTAFESSQKLYFNTILNDINVTDEKLKYLVTENVKEVAHLQNSEDQMFQRR